MARKPFYTRKREKKGIPERDWIVQYAWSNTKPLKWLSIKRLLPFELHNIATNEKQCDAWLLGYCTDKKAQEQNEQKIAEQKNELSGSVPFEEFTRDWYVPGKCAWLKVQINVKKKSFKNNYIKMKRGHLTNHFCKAFGKLPLKAITKATVENSLADKNLSTQTIKHMLGTLKPIFDDAEERDLITKNPLRHINISKVTHKEKGIFSLSEIHQLWPDEIEELKRIWGEFRIAFFYWLKFSSGMRLGEVIAAKWEQFDWDAGLFELTRVVDSDRKISEVTKSKEQRCIVLPWSTIDIAKAWRNLTPYPADDDYVFFGDDPGRPADKDNFEKKFKPALEEAKIERGSRILTPHSLRHTYKTLLDGKVTKLLLDLMIGHKSQQTTAMDKIYIHKTPREKILPFINDRAQIDQVFKYDILY